MTIKERKNGPPISDQFDLSLRFVEQKHFFKGVDLFVIKSNRRPVIRFEIIFPGGRTTEHKKCTARICASMLKEGTSQKSSAQIAKEIDYYGASLHSSENVDFNSLTLYCLKSQFQMVLPIVEEVISLTSFPEHEFDLNIKNTAEKIKQELSKNESLAYREITSLLYGLDHPYGYNTTEELLKQVKREDLIQYHREAYINNKPTLILSGMIEDNEISMVENLVQSIFLPSDNKSSLSITFPTNIPGKYSVQGKQLNQVSLKSAIPVVKKNHDDFIGLYVLNTILGGYFGSRLNGTIREKHGLTYGIYSSLDTHRHGAHLMLSLDTDPKHVEKCIHLIEIEMEKLQNELVPDHELSMVRNYINGYMLSALDGPINTAELVRSLITDNLPLSLFDQWIKDINEMTPQTLQKLAQQYLIQDRFITVIAGK